jgi:trans-2,3-dihydro-3-hydroxyanthranilate isomerase
MQREFVTVDVFADTRFGGNPLAVVPDARGLSTAQMQAIAAEFNLSETTFVLPPRDDAHTAEVRIFTPRAEMPFAGHPNVGTAFALAQAGECFGRPVNGDEVTFEEKAGLVRLSFLKNGAAVIGARLAAPQPLMLGEDVSPEIVAQACGLAADDIELSRHGPRIASCGTPFVFAQVITRAALAAARPRAEVFAQHLPIGRATGIHLYLDQPADGGDIACRMFAPLHGVHEDPATGSAAVALIGLLATLRPEPDLTLRSTLSQGVDMGRPSILETQAHKVAGIVTAMLVGGKCVPVMRGTIALD